MTTSTITTKFYSDAGHGWYAVKKQALLDLGIADKISAFSYMKGKTAYLEEHSDSGVFFNACKIKNIAIVNTKQSYSVRSPIRSYAAYITAEQALADSISPARMDATKFLGWCITNDIRGAVLKTLGKNLYVNYEFEHDGQTHTRTIYGHYSMHWVN